MRPKVESEKKARTRGVSLTPLAFESVQARVESLHPFVRTFSAYFQLLAEMDLRDGLIEQELARKLQSQKEMGRTEGAPQVRKLRGNAKN